jgi:hypothetical protein
MELCANICFQISTAVFARCGRRRNLWSSGSLTILAGLRSIHSFEWQYSKKLRTTLMRLGAVMALTFHRLDANPAAGLPEKPTSSGRTEAATDQDFNA